MFKHDQSLLVHASRRTSPRLHRRPTTILAATQEHAVAALAIGHKRRRFRQDETPTSVTPFLDLLAAEARVAELEAALSEARAAAFTDALTGALNRRGFDEAYQREVARAGRSGRHLTLALIDLDDFKRLNDTLGHQAGDDALVHLVATLRKALRPSDVLCRFGGEEFVLMLPETTLAQAAAVISRFQRQFAATALPGWPTVLTFSAGVVVRAPSETLEETLARADAATYAAKRAGKNCVVKA